jgi:hypothetical protein
MTIHIATAARTAMLDTLVDLIDAGSGAGTIKVYTGAQPANANAAASGTLLVTVTLNDPAFDAAAAGVVDADVTPQPAGVAVAAGNAGWARVADSAGVTVFDGSVTATGGGGDFIIAAGVALSVSQNVTLTIGNLTLPA